MPHTIRAVPADSAGSAALTAQAPEQALGQAPEQAPEQASEQELEQALGALHAYVIAQGGAVRATTAIQDCFAHLGVAGRKLKDALKGIKRLLADRPESLLRYDASVQPHLIRAVPADSAEEASERELEQALGALHAYVIAQGGAVRATTAIQDSFTHLGGDGHTFKGALKGIKRLLADRPDSLLRYDASVQPHLIRAVPADSAEEASERELEQALGALHAYVIVQGGAVRATTAIQDCFAHLGGDGHKFKGALKDIKRLLADRPESLLHYDASGKTHLIRAVPADSAEEASERELEQALGALHAYVIAQGGAVRATTAIQDCFAHLGGDGHKFKGALKGIKRLLADRPESLLHYDASGKTHLIRAVPADSAGSAASSSAPAETPLPQAEEAALPTWQTPTAALAGQDGDVQSQLQEDSEEARAAGPAPQGDSEEVRDAPHGGHKASGALTADGAAAVEGLRVLADAFRDRGWPSTKMELRAAIAMVCCSEPHWLVQWKRFGTLGKTEQKRTKNVATIFTAQWQKLGVLSGTKKGCSWHASNMQYLLAQHSSAQPAAATSAGAASSLSESCSEPQVQAVQPHSQSRPGAKNAAYLGDPRSEPQFQAWQNGESHTSAPIEVVTTASQLQHLLAADAALRGEVATTVAIDCEGVPEDLHLLQVATRERVVVLDCVKLGPREACEALSPLLTSEVTTKVLHDLHNDAAAISQLGGVRLRGCLDSQLGMELLFGKLHLGMNDMLKQLGHAQHPSKLAMKKLMDAGSGGSIFAQRPLPHNIIEYAALDVSLLLAAHERLAQLLGDRLPVVKHASDNRAHHAASSGGRRRVCVDVSNEHSLASRELIEACRPESMQECAPLIVSSDIKPLLSLLPDDIANGLGGIEGITLHLADIVLDKGRRPQAWHAGKRVLLGAEDRLVTTEDLDGIVGRLGNGFGSDNRGGLDAQLHRISAIRNRADAIIGLTMRVGRHVAGNVAMIADLLFHNENSILFLGEPGSGKTTVVREATRLLAEMSNVLIVDTSNEIAGDGDVPHDCVGFARRLQVPSLDHQSSVMIEGVQNHTPEVMVIDEIGRPAEVEAARTVKQRGVRMIASAHGDLRKLLKNKQLRGLVGGVEVVVLGDAQAKTEAGKRGVHPTASIDKIKAQRAGSPIFDVIVELRRGELHEWRIVTETVNAVDRILEGTHYLAQRRIREPSTGEFFLELERA